MKRLLAAIRFLTPVPIPGAWGTAERDLAGSVAFFPVIGLLMGAVVAAIAWAMGHLAAGPMLAAAVVVVMLVTFSGGLHIDGLSDTADGFLSARQRQRVLEIMKDSHVGAMGVLAIVSVLLVKFAALASAGGLSRLPSPGWLSAPALGRLTVAALLMPLAGRVAIVIQMALLDYVRAEGLGKVFSVGRRPIAAAWSIALLAGTGWLVSGSAGLVVAGVTVAVAVAFAGWCRRRIGGSTGDTFGAACELGELAAAVTLAVWPVVP